MNVFHKGDEKMTYKTNNLKNGRISLPLYYGATLPGRVVEASSLNPETGLKPHIVLETLKREHIPALLQVLERFGMSQNSHYVVDKNYSYRLERELSEPITPFDVLSHSLEALLLDPTLTNPQIELKVTTPLPVRLKHMGQEYIQRLAQELPGNGFIDYLPRGGLFGKVVVSRKLGVSNEADAKLAATIFYGNTLQAHNQVALTLSGIPPIPQRLRGDTLVEACCKLLHKEYFERGFPSGLLGESPQPF